MRFAVLFLLSITFRSLSAFAPVPEEEPAKASSRRLSEDQHGSGNSLVLLSTLPLRAMALMDEASSQILGSLVEHQPALLNLDTKEEEARRELQQLTPQQVNNIVRAIDNGRQIFAAVQGEEEEEEEELNPLTALGLAQLGLQNANWLSPNLNPGLGLSPGGLNALNGLNPNNLGRANSFGGLTPNNLLRISNNAFGKPINSLSPSAGLRNPALNQLQFIGLQNANNFDVQDLARVGLQAITSLDPSTRQSLNINLNNLALAANGLTSQIDPSQLYALLEAVGPAIQGLQQRGVTLDPSSIGQLLAPRSSQQTRRGLQAEKKKTPLRERLPSNYREDLISVLGIADFGFGRIRNTATEESEGLDLPKLLELGLEYANTLGPSEFAKHGRQVIQTLDKGLREDLNITSLRNLDPNSDSLKTLLEVLDIGLESFGKDATPEEFSIADVIMLQQARQIVNTDRSQSRRALQGGSHDDIESILEEIGLVQLGLQNIHRLNNAGSTISSHKDLKELGQKEAKDFSNTELRKIGIEAIEAVGTQEKLQLGIAESLSVGVQSKSLKALLNKIDLSLAKIDSTAPVKNVDIRWLLEAPGTDESVKGIKVSKPPVLQRRLEVSAGEVESTIKELGPQFYGNLLLYVGLADLGLESLPKYPDFLPSGVHSLLQLGLENRDTLGPQELMRRGLQVINSMDNDLRSDFGLEDLSQLRPDAEQLKALLYVSGLGLEKVQSQSKVYALPEHLAELINVQLGRAQPVPLRAQEKLSDSVFRELGYAVLGFTKHVDTMSEKQEVPDFLALANLGRANSENVPDDDIRAIGLKAAQTLQARPANSPPGLRTIASSLQDLQTINNVFINNGASGKSAKGLKEVNLADWVQVYRAVADESKLLSAYPNAPAVANVLRFASRLGRRNLESSELPSGPKARLGDEDLENLGYAMLILQDTRDDQKASISAMGVDQLSKIGRNKGYNLSSGELRNLGLQAMSNFVQNGPQLSNPDSILNSAITHAASMGQQALKKADKTTIKREDESRGYNLVSYSKELSGIIGDDSHTSIQNLLDLGLFSLGHRKLSSDPLLLKEVGSDGITVQEIINLGAQKMDKQNAKTLIGEGLKLLAATDVDLQRLKGRTGLLQTGSKAAQVADLLSFIDGGLSQVYKEFDIAQLTTADLVSFALQYGLPRV